MYDIISQAAIFVLGTTSIILIDKKNRWGFVVGLASQPFWLYTSYSNQQWGIFCVSMVYSVLWAYGIYEWFKDKRK